MRREKEEKEGMECRNDTKPAVPVQHVHAAAIVVAERLHCLHLVALLAHWVGRGGGRGEGGWGS